MSRSRKIAIVSLSIFALIIILPPIINGYIYPTAGDDSALHMSIIKDGDYWNQLYYGYVFIGYPLNWICNLIHADFNEVFLWLNYLCYIGVGFSFYFVLSRLINYKAGLFALVLPFFASLGLWWQFDDGMIFNIINMGIVLPFLIYFGVRWYRERRLYQLTMSLILMVVASVFHSSSIYFAPSLLLIIVVYSFFNRHRIDWKVLSFLATLLVINLVGVYILYQHTQELLPAVQDRSFAGKLFPIGYYFMGISIFNILILVYSAFTLWNKILNLNAKILLVILGCIAVSLLVASLGISAVPDRQIFDLSTIVALIVCVCIGLLTKKELIVMTLVALIAFFYNFSGWFSYRNAVQPADNEAIQYLQGLDAKTFTTSSNVANKIYQEYLHEQYIEGESDILVLRNKPMTPCSDHESIAYVPHGIDSTEGYVLDKTFDDGQIQVEIWGKIK